MIQWRVCWASMTNISFNGYSDWEDGFDPEETQEELEAALYESSGHISMALSTALEASGFDYWVEFQEVVDE